MPMVHGAVYDTVNPIVGGYEPYLDVAAAYDAEYAEVKGLGASTGGSRTAEQTALATFYISNPVEMCNRTFRTCRRRRTSMRRSSRVSAPCSTGRRRRRERCDRGRGVGAHTFTVERTPGQRRGRTRGSPMSSRTPSTLAST
jgi:hypothetical protein